MLPSRISHISAKGRLLSVSLSQVYSVTFAAFELSRRLKIFISSEEKELGGGVTEINSITNKDFFSIKSYFSKVLFNLSTVK